MKITTTNNLAIYYRYRRFVYRNFYLFDYYNVIEVTYSQTIASDLGPLLSGQPIYFFCNSNRFAFCKQTTIAPLPQHSGSHEMGASSTHFVINRFFINFFFF